MRAGLVDASVATVLLAIVAPLLLPLMLVNRIVYGRVLFRQVRLGLDLRPFALFKLCTMVEGAEQAGTVTVAGDARVTTLGRFLRRWKLDELPQLVNVVRRDLRLVGPRALPRSEIETLPRALAAEVYAVPPGLTGIGSLAFIDEERQLAESPDPTRAYFAELLPRKMQIERDYARRRTWATDFGLLLLTVPAILLPRARPRIVRMFLGW